MQNGYGKLKAGSLVVTEFGDLVMLTGDAHYLSGEYSGLVLRMKSLRLPKVDTSHGGYKVPSLELGEGVMWSGKILRPVGHVDDHLTGLDKLDLTPAEKPDFMLSPEERLERLEAKLAAVTGK